ncbi:MAG: pyridoxamine 5'-phosphate oxidase family protein [Myxococcota bacterium]|nr:pyridoxamine 5'-phosphate oxidase family protein [Myxococcota bacterium]
MTIKGPWSQQQITQFFEEVRVPLRIACNGLSGNPVLASLWYLPEDGRLWCATQSQSSAARLIAQDGRCAFEVSLETIPYRGVRGQGSATLDPSRGEEVLRRLIDRYIAGTAPQLAQTLLQRLDTETAIVITPDTLVAWDFTERMIER